MQVRRTLSCLGGILLCASTSLAGALPTAPIGTLVVDGTSYPVEFTLDDESGLWNTSFSIDVPGQYEVSFSGVIDPDPSISYGLGVIDFGAPSTFGFSISSPIVSTASPTEVIASIAGGLIDATGNGFSLTPTLADADGDSIAEVQVASVGSPLQNMGVDVGSGVSYGSGTPGAIPGGYGSYSEPIQAGPNSGPYTSMQLTLGFTLSGGGDIAALTGHAEIAEDGGIVPEPSSVALGVIGVAALGFSKWRRRGQNAA
jgi:hypothetical protein